MRQYRNQALWYIAEETSANHPTIRCKFGPTSATSWTLSTGSYVKFGHNERYFIHIKCLTLKYYEK
jgi:hypothetical protein